MCIFFTKKIQLFITQSRKFNSSLNCKRLENAQRKFYLLLYFDDSQLKSRWTLFTAYLYELNDDMLIAMLNCLTSSRKKQIDLNVRFFPQLFGPWSIPTIWSNTAQTLFLSLFIFIFSFEDISKKKKFKAFSQQQRYLTQSTAPVYDTIWKTISNENVNLHIYANWWTIKIHV